MPTPATTAAATIRARVLAWATAQLSAARLDLPGEPFTAPVLDPEDPAGTSWARLSLWDGTGARLGIGDWSLRRQDGGRIEVEIITPPEVGDGWAREWGDALMDAFRNVREGGLVYREPSFRADPFPSEEEAEVAQRHTVEVPYYYDYAP